MPLKTVQSRAQRALVYLIEEVSLTMYCLVFCSVVALCGYVYATLTPAGQGLNVSPSSFWDGVYFSVVTVSSLGYGDLLPVGYSKLIAGFEVLFGLSFMGILVAKITSRRLSYHVQRLFVSDAQKRLDDFAEKFASLPVSFLEAMRGLAAYYQATPQQPPPGDNKDQILGRFKGAVTRMHVTSRALEQYFASEVENDSYFSIVPAESVVRVGDAVDAALYQLGQLMISLPAESKAEVLDGTSRQRIWELLAAHKSAVSVRQRPS